MTDVVKSRPWYLRGPIAVVKFAIGVVLCQRAMGAILVVGWTQRLIQRRVLGRWEKQSPPNEIIPQRTLPNWVIAEPNGTPTKLPRRFFDSMIANARQGFAGAFNIAVWTLPATSLWLYAWVLGWNISFVKLYEQSHLGFVIGFSGVLLFIATMLYVPIAHVRQSVTGDWRAFYNVRHNWRLARQARGRLLLLACVFALASAVVMIFRIFPYYAGSAPELMTMPVAELRDLVDLYFLATGAVLFPLYVAVWLLASRAYAAAAPKYFALAPHDDAWRPVEKQHLTTLAASPAPEKTLVAPVRWLVPIRLTAGRASTWTLTAASCLVWFAVALEVFLAQFFNYIPGVTWLNHPLVLLPWIRYLPPGLTS